MDPFLGEIRMSGFNFAPPGWVPCDGRLLSIAEESALFNLLGTTYGGDGVNTFGVPDLRGRTPIHFGQGIGLSNRQMGESFGKEAVTLIPATIPLHYHTVHALSTVGTSTDPTNNYWASASTGEKQYANAGSTQMSVNAIGTYGNGQPHENMMPFTTLNFMIATSGIYPPQS